MIPKSILGILTSISFLRFWHIFLLPFIIWIGDKCLIFILYVILELTFYFTGKYDYARLYKLSLVATEEQLSDFRKWQWWRARFIVAQKTSKILEILYVPQLVEKQISFFQVSIPARKNWEIPRTGDFYHYHRWIWANDF